MTFDIKILVPLFFVITSCDCSELSNGLQEVINLAKLMGNINKHLQDGGLDANESQSTLMKMIDASAKLPKGLMMGNGFDLGAFDECYDIQARNIFGKYCLGTIPLDSSLLHIQGSNLNTSRIRKFPDLHPNERLLALGSDMEYIGFHFALCIPSNMAAGEIKGIQTYSEELCYSKATEPELSTGAAVTIGVLAVFAAAIVASTAFDIVLYYRKQESPHELLLAFSFLTNGRKIFTSSTNKDQLLCLNGLRAISMMWVIFAHEYSLATNGPVSNMFDIPEFTRRTINMILVGATVSVDTFFAVGGFLTVYTYLKAVKKGVKFNIFLYWVHRVIRLAPPLVIACLIYMFLVQYMGNGPLWKVVDITLVQTCKDAWWSTLLYISQYMKQGNCVPQTWYLSVDMELYFFSPLILVPLSKWPKYGLGALGVLILGGVVVPFAIGYAEDLGSSFLSANETFMNEYYFQTYTRFGPYVIGMMFGYIIFKVKSGEWKLKITYKWIASLWVVSLGGLAACVWASHDLQTLNIGDHWGNSMYLAFNRQAWALGVCGVIFLCVLGYGGPIDGFLSLPVFQFLTKVSYSMYLVHYAVITIRYSVMRNSFYFSNYYMMHQYWADFVYTLAISVIFCLAFESPIIILEKYIFDRGASKQRHAKEKLSA